MNPPSPASPIPPSAVPAPPRTTLYMIRHGEPAAEFVDRFYGQMDVPLSERGERQSLAVAERLSAVPFDAVYSSDLKRAEFLADRIAERCDLPVRRLEVFRERRMGRLEGMTEAEMREAHPEEYRRWKADRVFHAVEGGENFEMLRDRIVPAVKLLVEAFPGARIALACHGGPIRVTLAHVLGMPLENIFHLQLDYACVNVIEFVADGTIRVKLING